MKNNFLTLLIIVVLTTIFLLIFLYSKDVMDSITFSISIWKDNLLPSLFPFFLISDLLIEYGFIDIISFVFGKYMIKLFGLPKEASFILFSSLFSGFPSGSKYTKDLLEKNIIDEQDANHLIMFTHYSNPLFIISTIGILLLNNKNIGLLILFCHIISNIIIGILFRKKRNQEIKKERFIEILSNINKKRKNNKSFISILTNSIMKSFTILIQMLGIIMFFLIITTLLKKIVKIDFLSFSIISGIIEMTQGIQYISSIETLNIRLKSAIIGLLISFSGISVHFQVKSIIENTAIKYKNFFIARIIHALLCFILIYILFNIFI